MENKVKITPAAARELHDIYTTMLDAQEKKIKEALDACEKKTEESFVEHSEPKESPRDLEQVFRDAADKHGMDLSNQQVRNYANWFLKLASVLSDRDFPLEEYKKSLSGSVKDVKVLAQGAQQSIRANEKYLTSDINKLDKKVKSIEQRVNAVEESRIPITDQRAKDMLALQVELLSNYSHFGADANVAARCTSYGLWAYLQSSNGATITPMPAEEVEQ